MDDNGLGELVPEEYRQAEASFQEGHQLYGKDNRAAKEALMKAIEAYTAIIDKGFPLKIAPVRAEAETAKSEAETLKAQVAVKDLYTTAAERYRQAVAAQEAGQYQKALELFGDARRRFEEVVAAAKKKKAAAEAALQATQEGLAESERKAREADSEMGSGQ